MHVQATRHYFSVCVSHKQHERKQTETAENERWEDGSNVWKLNEWSGFLGNYCSNQSVIKQL